MRRLASSRPSHLSLLVLGVLCAPAGAAADGPAAEQEWPVVLTFGTVSLGFHPGAPHPVATIGTEVSLACDRIVRLTQGVELGAAHLDGFATTLTPSTRTRLRLTSDIGIYGELSLPLGVAQGFTTADTYQPDAQGFVASDRVGYTTFRGGLAAGLGIDLERIGVAPLRAFVTYEQAVLAPFLEHAGVPLMGEAVLSMGVAFVLGPPLGGRE